MRKYIQKLLPAFINGKKTRKSKSAFVCNGGFWSYETLISVCCEFVGGKRIYLNVAKFSRTTSSQQNAIRIFAAENNIPLIECNQSDFNEVVDKYFLP